MSRASVSHCPKKLEVSVMFEPNRLASALLQAAYLRVAPAVRRSLGHVPASPAPAAVGSQIPLERAEAAERSAP
jgi:hypothetical protein